MAEIRFNKNYSNLIVSARGSSLNYRSGPGTNYRVMYNSKPGISYGRTSGNYYDMKDGRWLQLTANKTNKTVYVREDVTKLQKPSKNNVTKEQANKLIDRLVKSDEKIFENLIETAALIQTAIKKGINVSKYRTTLDNLTKRLNRRQEKMKDSKVLKWKAGLKAKYKNLLGKVKGWFSRDIKGAIGEPVSITTIIIIAVAGAGLATLAYFIFRPDYNESETDLKISADLKRVLQNVEPETAKKIKQDLEKQVDTAYYQGKTQGKFTGAFGIIKPLAFAALGFWGVTKFIDIQNKRKK